MLDILDQDIQYLPGVGPRRKTLLSKELGISTYKELLEYYPYKYVDRSRIYRINELSGDMPFVQIRARILSLRLSRWGSTAQGSWHMCQTEPEWQTSCGFGSKYIISHYKLSTDYIIFGRPTVFNGRYQFAHPDIDPASEMQLSQMGLQPYYVTTET